MGAMDAIHSDRTGIKNPNHLRKHYFYRFENIDSSHKQKFICIGFHTLFFTWPTGFFYDFGIGNLTMSMNRILMDDFTALEIDQFFGLPLCRDRS